METENALGAPGKLPVIASVLFHGSLIVIAIVGLPYIKSDLPLYDTPMPIEILDIADITQTDKTPTKSESEHKAPKKKPEEKTPIKTVAPQVTAKTPPKPIAPKAPDEVIYPKATKTPPPPKKPQTKPKPPEKKAPTASTEEPPEEFQSLLRNLASNEPETAEAPSNAQEAGETPSPLASFSQRMTMSERDALRRQLAQCWNLLAGARYAENLVVEIKLFMNPDRTIREARIVNQLRYNADSYFRAAADSALGALYNPRCSPLDLPPDKYDQWDVITVNFDPSDML